MPAVFRQDRDVLSKNPGSIADGRFALFGEGHFFWLTAFALTGELLSLSCHCAAGANGEAGPKDESRSGESRK
jgi:hypothetical protein